MSEQKWEVVDSVGGDLNAELLRSYLEAQGIPVMLSQEGIGHSIYVVNIGKLGKVDILVPTSYTSQAREMLEAFYAAGDQENEEGSEQEPPEEDSAGLS